MRFRQVLTLFVIVLLPVLTAGILTWRFIKRTEQAVVTPQESVADLGSVVTRVRALSRLETASMHVVNVSTITQSYELIPNAIGGDQLTLFAAGDVIAGIDLSQIKDSDVWREPDGTVVMRLPASQILVSRVDNRETHVVNRRTGFLRRADTGLEGRARQYAEQQIRNEAFHRGILTLASDNAEAKLAPLLHSLGFTKVRFERASALSQPRPPA
jgi:hypothetical protein